VATWGDYFFKMLRSSWNLVSERLKDVSARMPRDRRNQICAGLSFFAGHSISEQGRLNQRPLLASMPHLDDVTIVVVEDHADARDLIGVFLRREGAQVIVTSDGYEGLDAVKNFHPDLVLSDIAMPGRNGVELLHDIRSLGSEDGGNVPVIAMTALIRSSDRRSQDEGFQRYLRKPFGPRQLIEAIDAVLPNDQGTAK
jgi:CheY-like chemotaxis protein